MIKNENYKKKLKTVKFLVFTVSVMARLDPE
jgi:hypothetical protein